MPAVPLATVLQQFSVVEQNIAAAKTAFLLGTHAGYIDALQALNSTPDELERLREFARDGQDATDSD